MNRLAALEANTTLYTRYLASQTSAMHDALRRLSEDVGRLEGIGRANALHAERALAEMERQRRRMLGEQRMLAARLAALRGDVVLEKRLGVAQLVLVVEWDDRFGYGCCVLRRIGAEKSGGEIAPGLGVSLIELDTSREGLCRSGVLSKLEERAAESEPASMIQLINT